MLLNDISFDYFLKLKEHCEKEKFLGWDPFDGLNSTFFQSLPGIRKNRFCRLVWIQLFKQSPINFRPLFGVKKEYNPKGLGLFLSGYSNLYKTDPRQEYREKILFLIEKLMELQTKAYSGSCWGYNFDWQSKAFFQPKGTPSVVVTSFIACSLLDAYEILKEEYLLETARSACDFILKDLNRSYDNSGDFSFSYSPLDKTQVYNASLLGCRLLCRVFNYTGESILLEEAKKAVSYVCKRQKENGSWTYSPLPFHQWVDNFHTGYNLECIYTYQSISGDNSFKDCFERGMNYYLTTFFEENGIPDYYNNSRYPIDLHTTAQLIVTLSKTNRLEEKINLLEKVLNWSQENQFDSKNAYFYYYKFKYYTIKIEYMRWIQAWMFLGYSHLFLNTKSD